MQGYAYSVFSGVAIVIHLIVNFDLLSGRKEIPAHGASYRGFLVGTLAYYIADALWGILAGLGWTRGLYVDTVLFFLSLAAFVFMWNRFVITYLNFGQRPARILAWSGYALLAFNLVMLTANVFNGCLFSFDEQGRYLFGDKRDLVFALLIVFYILMAIFVFAKAAGSRDSVRRRSIMVFLFCLTMAAAVSLQVVWPLTPFTALGCLIGNCFIHVFIIEDEQNARHMAELEKALDRAREAEKARSMFFSIVSHDIRTPLNAILGYAELLQDEAGNRDERSEALRSIRESGTTLLQLVDDVLDFAKMDSGKMTLLPGPVRLSQLTEEVFASFRLEAAGKGIELISRTAEVPTLLLDEHRSRQILFNLVGNAVKFTARGSVTVTASYAGKNLEFAVSDTGCGIAPDMLTRIMDPFFRVRDPSHAAARDEGTGLGLSICKRLAEAMGGELSVESVPGQGSTFRVRIPGVARHEEKTDGKKADAARKLPQHVLVVDDSPVNRKVLAAFLKKAGITTIEQACDGAEALEKLGSAWEAGLPHDFIISDLWMPNINGLELVEKLRADPRFRRLPVFALTADTECRQDIRSALFTGVLFKPLTYGKLEEVFAKTNRA